MTRAHHVVTRSPASFGAGIALGLLAIVFIVPLGSMWAALVDEVRPVIVEWKVTETRVEGADLILTGTMVKQRNCLYLPPTIARDQAGQNYAVESASPTAGKTWAATSEPQQFGPWRIPGGADKTLEFVNVYVCGNQRPSIVRLGVYVPSP